MDAMDDIKMNKKVVLSGTFEDVVQINEHYYLISKKQRIAVLCYTIDSKGLLDKVGGIKDYNYVTEDYDYTLFHGYVSQDDGTNLVAANRILFEIIGLNITNADDWMYLGSLYNNLTSDSPIDLYCVDMTDKELPKTQEVNEDKEDAKFKLIDSSYAITSDDNFILSAFFRLFNYFYINSLDNYANKSKESE